MSELPSGTVTFLFTDIEGSTRLLHELGEAYAGALAVHRRLLRDAFARYGGVEVDTQGDAFFVAFPRASDALAAAVEAQGALSGPVRVRMGLHTGEPLVTDEGYIGIDVHRAARIAAVGHGGQVLVSQSTRDLVGADGLRDLGEHRLKDLLAPERIYQLGAGDFPPLKSLNATNLPVAANPLVGRERELYDITELLVDSARLVTLTGPGGTGKTRLALQAAAELVGEFAGGVFFVPLAGVQQAELVLSAITSRIGVSDVGELRDREALLLIDNFEHLLEAAPAIAELLRTAAQTKVLTTSRAPLRVEGEHEYPVDPLPDTDAVTLLSERARAVRPDFEPDEATLEICRRLDGLPLALELAASRLRSLDSSALLERLERRLPVLTSGRRDVPHRQKTLRATIEWSYELLDSELQVLFAKLSVFATFTLEAAEAVTGAAFEQIDALVEASLLKPLSGRFLILETIREYAAEQLAADPAAETVHVRHAEFFIQLARRAHLNVEADGPVLPGLVIPERDNMRAALQWTVDAQRPDLGLELAIALENYWVTAGDPREARRWIETLLALGSPSPEVHALALRCIANCAVMLNDADGIDLYKQSTAEFGTLGDELRVAIGNHRLATNIVFQGPVSKGALEASDDVLAKSVQLVDDSHAYFQRVGFKKGEAQCLSFLGDVARLTGSPERSLQLYEQSIELSRQSRFVWWEKNVRLAQALTFFALGRPREAARAAGAALELAGQISDRIGIVVGLAYAARAAAELGDEAVAGRIWGAIEAEDARTPIPGWTKDRERFGEPLLPHTGAVFEAARREGRELRFEDAVALALELVRV